MKKEKIPEGWKTVELKHLVDTDSDIVAGPFGSNLKVIDYVDKGVPIIRLQNIERNRFIDKDIKYVSKEKAEELKYHSFCAGDIILAKLGDPIGKTCIVPDYLIEGIVVSDVVRIRISPKKASKSFIEYYLNSSHSYTQFASGSIGTTRQRVNLSDVREIKILLPSIPEQNKIASILSKVDEVINETGYIISSIERLKKGLMQEVFADGKVKANGKEIADICTVRRGASPRPIDDPKWFADSDVGWVRIEDVTKSNRYLRQTKQYLSPEGVSKSVLVLPGDLIMSICGTIGKPVIVDMKACIHDGFVVFRDLKNDVEMDYFYYALQYFENVFSGKGQPGTQKNINTSIVGGTKIPVPDNETQKKIIKAFSEVDRLIESEKERRNQLVNLKKGLMQKLLSGEIKVKVI